MDELKKLQEIILKAVPIIYLLGFCIINGYLSNFEYSEYNILNVTFFKAGFLFTICVSIIILVVYHSFTPETMTDDFTKAYPSILHSIYQINVIICVFTIPFLHITHVNILSAIIVTIVSFYVFWISSYPAKRYLLSKSIFLYYALAVLPYISLIAYLFSKNYLVGIIWLFGMLTGAIAFLSFGDFGDKQYNIQIVRDFIFLIALSLLFGKFVYGELPTVIGGGKPYQMATARKLEIYSDSIINKLDTFQVLYESDVRYILKDKKGQVFNTKKDELKTVLLIKK